MKTNKLILLTFISFIFFACHSQDKSRIDLEKLTYNEDVRILLKGKMPVADTSLIKSMSNAEISVRRVTVDTADVLTNLPTYRTYAIDFFKFGDVDLSNRNLGGDDVPHGSVSMVLNSLQQKKIVGMIIGIGKIEDARKLDDYIKQKYGKPIVIAPEPKPNKAGIIFGDCTYLWRNIQPNHSLVMANNYSTINGKQAFTTEIYIIQNDAKTQSHATNQTALDRILAISKH
jgi:hypothetical protein